MIYVKSHYNRLDRMYFGHKLRYDYKRRITTYLTKFLKSYNIIISQDNKSYLKNNLISLFTIYRYFKVKISEIYRLINQLLINVTDCNDVIAKKFADGAILALLNNSKGFTQAKNIE